VACCQVNELKKQLDQAKQQQLSDAGMMLDDVSSDLGDLTFRVGYTASAATSDNKQKEKIRQIERQRREAHDVGYSAVCCNLNCRTTEMEYSHIRFSLILRNTTEKRSI